MQFAKQLTAAAFMALTLATCRAAGAGAPGFAYSGGIGEAGYMKVAAVAAPGTLQFWLQTSGRCIGNVLIDGRIAIVKDGRASFSRKEGKQTCTTYIDMTLESAYVFDTCITPQWKGDPACILVGEYGRITE